jgi:hypothetical protein
MHGKYAGKKGVDVSSREEGNGHLQGNFFTFYEHRKPPGHLGRMDINPKWSRKF